MLVVRKFLRDVPATIGLLIVVFVAFLAAFGPHLAPFPNDAFESHILQRLRAPSGEFPFGTDNLGRDVFSRVILGSRYALGVALMVVAIAIAIGVPLGLIAGYVGGWASEVIM
ncbi:MAG: ABC transporter permease, partial [Alphaproteobacteria bacterium]|nr:ABC transporter permease [Alphaproteobacteria bacterium]